MFRKAVLPGLIAVLLLGLLLPLTTLAQVAERRTGEWQQFVLRDDGHWHLLGTFLVQQERGDFLMVPVTQTKDGLIINSRGLFDVKFTASGWSFRSDWGKDGIGVFRLNKLDRGIYQGWSYSGEQRLDRNLWILVK